MSDIAAASSVSAALLKATSSNAHASYEVSRHGGPSAMAHRNIRNAAAETTQADSNGTNVSATGSSTFSQILNLLA